MLFRSCGTGEGRVAEEYCGPGEDRVAREHCATGAHHAAREHCGTDARHAAKEYCGTGDHGAGREPPGQVVGIRSGGLATSSRTVRTWRRAGRLMHHLVDPRTGRPAPGTWRCVSVAAADCVGANTAATAAMILGADAPQWLAARALPARLVAADGSVHTVAGWPAAPKGAAA